MPQVPIVTVPSELPGHAQPVFQSFDTSGAFGEQIGRAMQGFGAEVSQFGQVLAANQLKLQGERDTADANNQYIKAKIEQAGVDANYFSLEGSNATDAYPDYVKSLEEIRQRHIAQLGSDKARKLFDNDFTRSTVTDIGAASRHAATQHKVYVSGQSDARVQEAINDSAAKFNNPGAFDNNLDVIGREIDNKGRTEGWSADKVTLEKNKAQGTAYAARIREMAIYAPFEAEKLFNDNLSKLDPDAVPVLENAIRTSKQTVGVKQVVGTVFTTGDGARPSLVKGMMTIAPVPGYSPDLGRVEPGLVDSVAAGATHLPPGWTIKVSSGYGATHGDIGSQHRVAGRGAIDVRLYHNGVEIPNKGADTTGMYKQLAQFTAMEMKARHPGMERNLRWGGTFETGKGSGVADLMHFDLGGGGGARIGAGDILHAQGPIGASGFLGRIIGAESGGRGGQIGYKGNVPTAYGLMQITPATAMAEVKLMNAEGNNIPYSIEHLLHDNSYNVMIGKHILNRLLIKYNGNEMLAAAAYNAGEGRVDSLLKGGAAPSTPEEVQAFISGLPQETQNYVHKVASSPGVGYDPAPGKAYFTTNLNTGTGSAGLPWSVRQAQIAAAAEQVAPGDPDFLERALSAGRTRYNIEETARTEETQAADNLLTDTAIKTKATSEEELLTNQTLRSAWEKLDAEKKRAVHSLLEANSRDDIPETPAMLRRYDEIFGKLAKAGSTEEKSKVEVYDPTLSRSLQKQLIDEKNRPVVEREAVQNKISINHALDVLDLPLRAAKIVKPESSLKDMSEAERTSYDATHNAFYGRLSEELTKFVEENKRPPSDDEIRQIGNDLLQTSKITDPGFWWGPTEKEIPLFLMSKQQVQDYLQVTPESADVLMESEVPNEIEAQIRASIVKKTGAAPSMEVIWKVYQTGKFEQLRALHKMTGGGP